MRILGNSVNPHHLQSQNVVHLIETSFHFFDGRWYPLLDELLQFRQSLRDRINRTAQLFCPWDRTQGDTQIIQPEDRTARLHADHPTTHIGNESLGRPRNHQILFLRKDEDLLDPLQSGKIKQLLGNRLLVPETLVQLAFQLHQ